MKRFLFFLCLVLPFSTMANSAQTIQIDDDHLQFERADGKASPFYSIQAATSLELDATSYKFHIPPQLAGKQPNVIQLVLGKDQRYSARWVEGQTRYLLSGATLTVVPGSTPFSGFAPGAQGVIAIGHLDGNGFAVVWAGMFNVQR